MEKHNTMTSPSSPTFVQADTHTFRDLVQTLTGSSAVSEKLHVNPPSKLFPKSFTPVTSHWSSPVTFKLHERRQTLFESCKGKEGNKIMTALRLNDAARRA
jgi:hypothetical protein